MYVCPVLVCRGTEGISLAGTLSHRDVMTTEPEEVAIFHPDMLSGYILIPQSKEGDVTSEMAANGPAGSECCCGWL